MFAALVQQLPHNEPPSLGLTAKKRPAHGFQGEVNAQPFKRWRRDITASHARSSHTRCQNSYLLAMPAEIRKQIYGYLFEESEVRIHHYAEVLNKHGSITYTQPDISLGPAFATFSSISPSGRDKRSTYALIANGSHGITQASSLLRAETLHLFLTHTTFICPDPSLFGVLCTHIPAAWKPHIRNFAGWIAGPYPKIHDTLPVDRDFSNVRSIHLTIPKCERDDAFAMLLPQFLAMTEAETKAMLCTLRPYGPLGPTSNPITATDNSSSSDDDNVRTIDGPTDTHGPNAPVDVFMLVATRQDIAWRVSRDLYVVEQIDVERKSQPDGGATTARSRKTTVHDLGRFTITYSSRANRTTRHLRFLLRNNRLIEPGKAMLARWDPARSYVGPVLREEERRLLDRGGLGWM